MTCLVLAEQLYVPASMLHEGSNEVTIFETDYDLSAPSCVPEVSRPPPRALSSRSQPLIKRLGLTALSPSGSPR